MIVGTS